MKAIAKESYFCKECRAPADVTPDGVIHRSCNHTGTVILDIQCTLYGRGGVTETTEVSPAAKAIAWILKILRLKGR